MDKVKFYTHYDRPECDCEYYEPGTSLTAPDQVEPIEVTVRRCMRGEMLNLKETYYENEGAETEDEAFSRMDNTDSPGFDLADVPSLLSGASAPDVAEGNVAEPKKEEKTTESETQSKDSSSSTNE